MLKSDLKKEKKQKLLEDVQKWLGDVKVSKTTELGEKKLAYPIKSAKSADYVLMEFEGAAVAADASRRIEMNDDVMRHLMVRVD